MNSTIQFTTLTFASMLLLPSAGSASLDSADFLVKGLNKSIGDTSLGESSSAVGNAFEITAGSEKKQLQSS